MLNSMLQYSDILVESVVLTSYVRGMDDDVLLEECLYLSMEFESADLSRIGSNPIKNTLTKKDREKLEYIYLLAHLQSYWRE